MKRGSKRENGEAKRIRPGTQNVENKVQTCAIYIIVVDDMVDREKEKRQRMVRHCKLNALGECRIGRWPWRGAVAVSWSHSPKQDIHSPRVWNGRLGTEGKDQTLKINGDNKTENKDEGERRTNNTQWPITNKPLNLTLIWKTALLLNGAPGTLKHSGRE